MKKILALGLALLCLLFSTSSHAAWNADWTKRVRIGLNTAADGLPLQSGVDAVPLLIRLHTGNFSFVDAKVDGTDLRFVANDDKTPLKFHIEKFDGLNELALVWVELPKLAPGSSADFIWLYYGNPAAPAASDSKTFYDADQALVYHFGDAQPVPQDATANANRAASSTARAGGAGLIGGDAVFDGNAQIQIDASPSLKLGANGATVSFWVKPQDLGDATLFAQQGVGGLRLALQGGKLVAQSGSVTAASSAALVAGAWQHVAVAIKDGLTIYVKGDVAGNAPGNVGAADGAATLGQGFKGEIDEFEIASTARSAAWIKVAAMSQGPDQKLIVYGQAEGGGSDSGGASTLHILLSSVTIDGWIVIAILIVMFVISVLVMYTKTHAVIVASRDNDRFKLQFEAFIESIKPGGSDANAEKTAAARFRNSSLYRLYAVGAHELRARFVAYAAAGHHGGLTDQTINAIRSTIDARMVRETQQLNSRMVLLTIAIAGGPFLGLLGTVVGVMITFAAIAAAGDVNVNAIAPGIAAALVATVAGLAVAIPALFGYNYLSSRISELNSDMQVFVDEFISRIAEKYSL